MSNRAQSMITPFLPKSPSRPRVCNQCRRHLFEGTPTHKTLEPSKRPFASFSPRRASAQSNEKPPVNAFSSLTRESLFSNRSPSSTRNDLTNLDNLMPRGRKGGSLSYKPPPKPHHLHIYATRHNCHMTLTSGNRDALISVSSGSLNFRKAQRGTYDAAFQLASFVMAKIKSLGMLDDRYPGKGGPILSLEVVLRDFGPGREAATKILMGQEGKELRQKVTRIMDGTRLKFGGTRSRKPRRLG